MGNLIHRGKGSFTHVENTIFYDRSLSLKAKGIYCQIRSIESNPEWVFTVQGFAALVSDGLASVKSGIKELEQSGYIIRARKRREDGRFASSEEALWVTLDDPGMYDEVASGLAGEGLSIMSKYRSAKEGDSKKQHDGSVEKAQVETTSRFSTCGEPTCGETTSGDSTCGQPTAINPLDHQGIIESKDPSLALPAQSSSHPKASEGMVSFDKDFEELCSISLKPIVALRFKKDCYEAWRKRLDEGYTPSQMLSAYRAYAAQYERRNGSDASMAKNLARWLMDKGGLVDYADDPMRCVKTNDDGSPLSMRDLAEVYKRFGRLWRKMRSRRQLVLSEVLSLNPDADEEAISEALRDDRQYCDFMDACRVSYDEYLRAVDPENAYGLHMEDDPLGRSSLPELLARKEEIRAMAESDPDFADLLERYEMLARDISECRLIGQLDDKAWEKKRYEELQLVHQIEERLEKRR